MVQIFGALMFGSKALLTKGQLQQHMELTLRLLNEEDDETHHLGIFLLIDTLEYMPEVAQGFGLFGKDNAHASAFIPNADKVLPTLLEKNGKYKANPQLSQATFFLIAFAAKEKEMQSVIP